MQRLLALWGMIGLSVACTRPAQKQDTLDASAIEDAGVNEHDAADAAIRDAGSRKPLADLLHATPATLGVSSTVNNPRDKPEHLVDGQLATAWNSKTGDLKGWIGFRVPEDARIDHLEMTVGFDRVTPTVDLFTANQRIRKVRVGPIGGMSCASPGAREHAREITLDVERRGLQSIPMPPSSESSYCLWIEETVPGTKTSWRELTVSELRVMGEPGAQLRDPEMPLHVGVGEVPRLVMKLTPTTWRDDGSEVLGDERVSMVPANANTLQALLARVEKEWNRLSAEEDAVAARDSDPASAAHYTSRGKVHCKIVPLTAPFQADAVVLEVSSLQCKDDKEERTLLAARTASGWTLTPIEIAYTLNDTDELYEEWVHRGVERVEMQAGHLVVVEALQHETYYLESQAEPVVARAASWCKIQPSLQCSRWHPSSAPALAIKRKPGATSEQIRALEWQQEVPFEIRGDGQLHRR